ncbi:MAG TPA: AAA family ATPase [Acidimicrobiales bacterium]|nr:AAA family ATPase [Acidimicrobiales bacterium]
MTDLQHAPALPEGPVTIMFTDIEGSTALRTTLGDLNADDLFARHDELVRKQIADHHGYDQHAALGDGFLAVFVSTKRAVACATAIQRALDEFNRQRSGPPLLVRIGLNTGEVTQAGGQVSGEAVHGASRVCAEADGGQVYVSDVTRQLAGTLPDVSYRDTGEHALKGFPDPWRLWEVLWVRETAPKAPPFVGRDDQLRVLRDHLTAALDGRGSTVLVGGEPGVGKTALVRQLISEAERRGALSVFGRCYESEGTVAYSPFVEMLEQALSLMPADVIMEDMGESAPEVARMVPELRRRFPDIPAPLDIPPEQQRRYFFNAVADFIARGAKRFPLVLVIDDVHWADESTLLLTEHLASRIPKERVLAIGTYRDVELEVSRPLAASLERMVRAQTVDRIHLSRFDGSGVGAVLQALSGRTPPQAIVDAVFAETEGNPFFVGEVYRHFVEEGRVLDANGEFRTDLKIDELEVPESVRLVVGRRLERLGVEAQKALAAAAVVGRAFPFRLLEIIGDLPVNDLVDVVDEAEAAQVLVSEERDGEVVFSFAHELIRQTLLSSLSVLRRQRMHLKIADALEKLDENAVVTRAQEIADHLLKAGASADRGRLIERLTTAAERAQAGAAFETTLRLTDDAMALLDELDHAQLGSMLELRGHALRALGRFQGSIDAWNRAVDHYIADDEINEAARVFWIMGVCQIWLGQMTEAFVTSNRAVQVVGDIKTPERLLVSSGYGGLMSFLDYDQAVEAIDDAIASVGDAADDRSLGIAMWSRCIAQWNWSRLPECEVDSKAAVQLLRRTTDAWGLADALSWAAWPLIWNGKVAEGRELAHEGAELAARVGHIGTHALCLRARAIADSLGGGADLDELERVALLENEMLKGVNSPWVALSHAWLATIHTWRGRIEDALAAAQRCAELMPPSAWTGLAEAASLEALAVAGDIEACRQMLRSGDFEPPSESGVTSAGNHFKFHAALVAIAMTDDRELAQNWYEAADRETGVFKYAAFDMKIAERVTGMMALTAGRLEDAERHLTEARRIAIEDPNRFDAPHVDYWYARLLVAQGRTGEAATFATAARDEFARLGAPPFLQAAEELLAQLA